jgi:hypothetical protein
MQDNATIHTANNSMHVLAEVFGKQMVSQG